LFISSSKDNLEAFVRRNLFIHKPSIGYIVNPKGKRAQYYTSIFQEAHSIMQRMAKAVSRLRKGSPLNDPDNTMFY